MQKILAMVGILAVMLFAGISQAALTGSHSKGYLPGVQVPAPIVPFGGDSSGQ